MNEAHAGVPVASLPGAYVTGPLAGGGRITDIINQRGVYNEYQDRYDAVPVPVPAGAQDRYDPAYDPRYDPNYQVQPMPPAPVNALPPPPPQQQIVPPPQRGIGGFFRRLFGN